MAGVFLCRVNVWYQIYRIDFGEKIVVNQAEIFQSG